MADATKELSELTDQELTGLPVLTDKDLKGLPAEERDRLIDYHLSELRKLRKVPRSDWHAGFEALLRIDTHKFGDQVHINAEVEIGVNPPRADFVVLTEDEPIKWEKAIFRIFRRINILEYKNPRDPLNERVLRKACGYANLYIGVAEHEGERPSDQVTISIFRAKRTPGLFEEMEKKGTLVKDAVQGIYHVVGYTDLPFQIVITGELQGEEYAAYRALTDNADQADVERVIEGIGQEKDDAVREHYRVLLRLVMAKNPRYIEMIRRGENMSYEAMDDILMEMMKDKVDERVSTAVDTERQQTTATHIKDIMESFKVTAERAMDSLKIPADQRSLYAGLVGNSKSAG